MDSSYERTSRVESLPMDGGDLPTLLMEMDLNCETPSQVEPPLPMVGEDWRTWLLPDSRQKIVNKILETLRRHLPVSGVEGLQELRKIAARFEDKIYSAATSQSDYLRKISLKMLTMESKSQNSSGSSDISGSPFQFERGDGTSNYMAGGLSNPVGSSNPMASSSSAVTNSSNVDGSPKEDEAGGFKP